MVNGVMRFKAHLFGPGLPPAGTSTEFEANENGIRVVTADANDAAPRWSAMRLQSTGWDGAQMRLEWHGDAGTYALTSGDAQVYAAIKKLAAGKSPVQSSQPDRATRALSHALIGLLVVLPLLLAAVVVWQHQRIVGWAVGHISIEQEVKLGDIIFNQQKARLKLVEGPPLAMVREIGGRLTANSRYRYQFFVAEDSSVNAFAVPGGFVVVHTGLLQLAATAEEVAGVLAHEVQHVEQRHSLRGMAQTLGLTAALGLLVGDIGGLASVGKDLLSLKFSRDHETEADREGLKRLVAAKVDPAGMREFFSRMAAQSALELGYLSTHPASAQRLADFDRMIKALLDDAIKLPPLAYDYAAIKASIKRRE
jgi:beta-barrel assembly-enhancing protease